MSTTRKDMVSQVAQSAGVTVKQASAAIDAMLDFVADSLAQDKKVQLHKFGTFSPTLRKARTGRNPRTGEAISIPARTSISFKASGALKDRVNQ